MTPALVLVHAGLAAVAVGGARLPSEARHRLVQAIAAAGAVCAPALVIVGDDWRTIDPSLPQGRLAALGTGVAWLLVLVGERRKGDWFTAACVGVASTGLLLAAANRWVVPLLLFAACSTTALLLMLRDATPSSTTRFAVAAGDVLIATGLAGAALADDSWARPRDVQGWMAAAIVCGTLLRSGAVPLAGIWGALRTTAAPALPLLVAGGTAIPLASLGARPWIAAMLLAGALVVAAWTLLHRELRVGLVAAWPVLLGLGAAFASTRAQASTGLQATLAVGAVALWPWTLGRAQAERGLLLAFLPLTAGSAGVVLAATAAFDAAGRTPDPLSWLSWALVVGLLPLALLAGVLLGARVGGAGEPEDFEPSAVLAVWALLAVAAVVWSVAPQGLGSSGGDGATLQVGAVMGAVAAGWLARDRHLPSAASEAPAATFRWTLFEPRPRATKLVDLAAFIVWAGGVAFVLWLTYEGLRLAFL